MRGTESVQTLLTSQTFGESLFCIPLSISYRAWTWLSPKLYSFLQKNSAAFPSSSHWWILGSCYHFYLHSSAQRSHLLSSVLRKQTKRTEQFVLHEPILWKHPDWAEESKQWGKNWLVSMLCVRPPTGAGSIGWQRNHSRRKGGTSHQQTLTAANIQLILFTVFSMVAYVNTDPVSWGSQRKQS